MSAKHADGLPVEFVGDEPTEPTGPLSECQPLTRAEAMFMVALAASGASLWLVIIAALVGYVWGWL